VDKTIATPYQLAVDKVVRIKTVNLTSNLGAELAGVEMANGPHPRFPLA
jgi:hypothetical protein